MIDSPECPVCSNRHWKPIGQRTFRKEDETGTKGWKQSAFKTVFEVWKPDARSFTVTYQYCQDCGMVIYTPRPTIAEVEAGFRLHAESKTHDVPLVPVKPLREALRARRLHSFLSPYLQGKDKVYILDYGGGDGHLMEGFLRDGAACHVIDYADKVYSGVISIGKTEDDLPENASYDMIMCSHVVEHLVDPLSSLIKLRLALKPKSILYVEVPVEVWRGPPRQSEPVTHLNFFTPASLKNLVLRAGYNVELCKFLSYPHPHGGWRMVASCIAKATEGTPSTIGIGGADEVEQLLHPSLRTRVWRRAVLARDVPFAIRQHVSKLARRM